MSSQLSDTIVSSFMSLRDDEQARHLMRFFRTGKGQYGEGDQFLGVRVPATRSLVKQFRSDLTLSDIPPLLASQWHEIRLTGFLLLIELFNKALKSKDRATQQQLVDFYLANIERGNNWDLVDLVAPKILGEWLLRNPESKDILYQLAQSDNLWRQRVAIVSTWTLIRARQFDDTFRLAHYFLVHPHDLIHKATGWMLREIGKRGGEKELIDFLQANEPFMPRTMYRYAIERIKDKI